MWTDKDTEDVNNALKKLNPDTTKLFKPDMEIKSNNLNSNNLTGICPRCNKDLIFRTAKWNGKRFIGCTGFPNCRYTENI